MDARLLERIHAEHHHCDDTRPSVENGDSGEFDSTLAMVYSPVQSWQNLYSVEEGLCEGTIFMELNKPFYGPRCNGGSYE
ncbi:MAG: spore coat associated protein CotJA [Clostridia bacterium]|nr:spore coat associated protein CotJA [Clostridia bacterium]